jgi:predicted RNA-binding Zn-ribbon protein involved in translation (DUF1610 family)
MGGNLIKVIVAIVLFATAAVLLFKARGDPETPRLAEDAAQPSFVCTECGHTFNLSLQEARAALEAPAPADADEPGAMRARTAHRRVRPKFVACLKCGEIAALRASRCSEHNLHYPTMFPDGSRGACPSCPSGGRE